MLLHKLLHSTDKLILALLHRIQRRHPFTQFYVLSSNRLASYLWDNYINHSSLTLPVALSSYSFSYIREIVSICIVDFCNSPFVSFCCSWMSLLVFVQAVPQRDLHRPREKMQTFQLQHYNLLDCIGTDIMPCFTVSSGVLLVV